MKTVLEILTAARTLVEAGWAQEAFARDVTGGVAALRSNDACLFCTMGAIGRAAEMVDVLNSSYTPAAKHFMASMGMANADQVYRWNDANDRTQAEVLAAFDKAIATVQVPA